MELEDYVAAYRKIIPPNLNRWVVFRHGTVFVLSEQEPGDPEQNPREEAIAFLKEHGPVLPGSPSGDFDTFKVKHGLGWLVRYSMDGMFNLVPQAECPEPEEPIVIGLMG